MKKIAILVSHVVVGLTLAHASACATVEPTKSADHWPKALDNPALAALEAQGPLYFDTDTDTLTAESQLLLQRVAEQMRLNGDVRLLIGGHADERGDTAYNLALGERRAEASRAFLARLGIDRSRVRIMTLGEERPLSYGHDELAWAKNRRDEFTFALPQERVSIIKTSDGDALADVIASAIEE